MVLLETTICASILVDISPLMAPLSIPRSPVLVLTSLVSVLPRSTQGRRCVRSLTFPPIVAYVLILVLLGLRTRERMRASDLLEWWFLERLRDAVVPEGSR